MLNVRHMITPLAESKAKKGVNFSIHLNTLLMLKSNNDELHGELMIILAET